MNDIIVNIGTQLRKRLRACVLYYYYYYSLSMMSLRMDTIKRRDVVACNRKKERIDVILLYYVKY